MNTKLKNILKDKIKDMGLTEKALEELSEIGSAQINDNATDEDITKVADSLVPYAKFTQAEITRKTQKPRTTETQSAKKQSSTEGEGEGVRGKSGEDAPEWFKAYQTQTDTQLQKLIAENDALKAREAKSERDKSISDTASRLGIPSYLMKRVSFKDDADIEQELTEFKQELVNNNLMPKGAAETGTADDQLKADAKSWADALPSL